MGPDARALRVWRCWQVSCRRLLRLAQSAAERKGMRFAAGPTMLPGVPVLRTHGFRMSWVLRQRVPQGAPMQG